MLAVLKQYQAYTWKLRTYSGNSSELITCFYMVAGIHPVVACISPAGCMYSSTWLLVSIHLVACIDLPGFLYLFTWLLVFIFWP